MVLTSDPDQISRHTERTLSAVSSIEIEDCLATLTHATVENPATPNTGGSVGTGHMSKKPEICQVIAVWLSTNR